MHIYYFLAGVMDLWRLTTTEHHLWCRLRLEAVRTGRKGRLSATRYQHHAGRSNKQLSACPYTIIFPQATEHLSATVVSCCRVVNVHALT